MSTDRLVAILGYCTLLGWVLGFLVHQRDRSSLGAFHLRQSLGIHVLGFLLLLVRLLFLHVPLGAPVRAMVDLSWAALFLCLLQGVVHAYRGRERPLPLIGEFIQEYFRSIA